MPTLVVIFGRDRGRHFGIPQGQKLTLGRSSTLNNRLNDPSISRKHLEFAHQEHNGKCIAIDLGSRNGARINNKRLFHTQELEDGDIIQVGYTLLVFVRVTFDAKNSAMDFLDACETQYRVYLERMRDHASIHTDRDADSGSAGGMSGTLHLGNLFSKKGRT